MDLIEIVEQHGSVRICLTWSPERRRLHNPGFEKVIHNTHEGRVRTGVDMSSIFLGTVA
jgi:hypothetical protein